jgi:hypothetical protein
LLHSPSPLQVDAGPTILQRNRPRCSNALPGSQHNMLLDGLHYSQRLRDLSNKRVLFIYKMQKTRMY